MICLEVHRKNTLICRAGIANASVLAAQVHAQASNEKAPAFLHISGLHKAKDGQAAQVCWNTPLPLVTGERISFSLVESDEPFAPVAFRPAEASGPASIKPARRIWPNVSMNFFVNGTRLVRAALGLGQEQILCAVHWDPCHPEHLQTVAHSSAEASGGARQPPQTEWLRLKLMQGDTLEIEVNA